jgi:iron-sulfur cluster assembly protein
MHAEQHPEAEPRVRLTAKAAEYAKARRAELGQPNAALRVGVKGGGCAGLTYVTELTDERPSARELVYDFFGLAVYVDERSLRYIDGSVIDYERTLMHQGFKWRNPLEASTCGCGTTFSVKT